MKNIKKLDKTLLSISSLAYKASIKFTEIIQNVMEILFIFNTYSRQELGVCLCKIGHVNGLEAMHNDINSVTTCQTRFKGHLSTQFG